MDSRENRPAPICVSQLTSEAVFGIPSRQFLELVRREGVPHIKRGKLVMVETAVLLDHLRSARPPENEPRPLTEEQEADLIAKRHGFRRAG